MDSRHFKDLESVMKTIDKTEVGTVLCANAKLILELANLGFESLKTAANEDDLAVIPSDQPVCTIGVAAQEPDVTSATISNWIDRGLIGGVTGKKRSRRIPRSEVERLKRTQSRKPKDQ